LSTAPPFILWWGKFEILFDPPHPQFFLPRRAALTTSSNVTQSAHKGKGGGGRARYYSHVYSILWFKASEKALKSFSQQKYFFSADVHEHFLVNILF
jgi:hypothetical protein